MRFVNIHFSLSEPTGSFLELWKVRADERYHPFIREGFPSDSLFLTHRGAGDIYLGDSTEPLHLPQQSSFLVPRDLPCHYHRHLYSEEWTFYFLTFHIPTAIRRGGLPWLKAVPLIERCVLLCEGFIDEIAWNRPGRDGILEMGLLDILTQIIRTDPPTADGIERVLRWMNGHPDLNFDLEKLLSLSRLTRTLFFTQFKARTGLTPQLYFNKLKVKAAQSLMETTDLKLSEIARRLNYCDEYYFSRQFKQITRLSPRSWRIANSRK